MTTTAYPSSASIAPGEFEQNPLFADLKNSAYEHLLSRIEELGAEFGRWSQAAIAQFVTLELPVSEDEPVMRTYTLSSTPSRPFSVAAASPVAGRRILS